MKCGTNAKGKVMAAKAMMKEMPKKAVVVIRKKKMK